MQLLNQQKSVIPLLLCQFIFTTVFYVIGQNQLLPTVVFESGYGIFASDSFANLSEAVKISHHLIKGEYVEWWSLDSRFHTRIASVCYVLWGKWTGETLWLYMPVNFLALYLTWSGWKSLVYLLNPGSRISPYIWIIFPSIILHYTQLLRDPIYITVFIWWVFFWLKLIGSKEKTNLFRTALMILLISPILFWSRERFWALNQLLAISIFCFSTALFFIRKVKLRVVFVVLIVAMCVNVNSLYKLGQRMFFPVTIEQKDDGIELEKDKLRYFRKIANLRMRFVKSYEHASSLDRHVLFESDQEVIAYLPRALQISYFVPFPNTWFSNYGKTGKGRLVGAFELSCMTLLMIWGVYAWLKRGWSKEVSLLLLIITVAYAALGLVISNGGALYRMRFAFWILWLAVWMSSWNCVRREVDAE